MELRDTYIVDHLFPNVPDHVIPGPCDLAHPGSKWSEEIFSRCPWRQVCIVHGFAQRVYIFVTISQVIVERRGFLSIIAPVKVVVYEEKCCPDRMVVPGHRTSNVRRMQIVNLRLIRRI